MGQTHYQYCCIERVNRALEGPSREARYDLSPGVEYFPEKITG
jgi:hypothetical protein